MEYDSTMSENMWNTTIQCVSVFEVASLYSICKTRKLPNNDSKLILNFFVNIQEW
jgi:hypothetical protein